MAAISAVPQLTATEAMNPEADSDHLMMQLRPLQLMREQIDRTWGQLPFGGDSIDALQRTLSKLLGPVPAFEEPAPRATQRALSGDARSGEGASCAERPGQCRTQCRRPA